MKQITPKPNHLPLLTIIMIIAATITISGTKTIHAQNTNPVDTAIVVSLENPLRNEADSTFRVDIYLTRSSDIWHLWENATFQMIFTNMDGSEIDYSQFDVTIDASTTEIVTQASSKPVYTFYPKVLHNPNNTLRSRVMIMVIGPEEAIYSKLFEYNVKMKLCTVILTAKTDPASLPVSMDWKRQPDDEIYYLGAAYKYVETVNRLPQYVLESKHEDNIEIGWITKHVAYPMPDPAMQIAHFKVEYTGNLNAACRYGTKSEINNAGFIIKRGEISRTFDTTNGYAEYDALPDSIFTHTVGDYRRPQDNDRMKGQIYSHIPKEYDPVPDVLNYRQVNYIYRLYYDRIDSSGTNVVSALATRNLITPNGLITKASASPNPSAGKSMVVYEVTDDVYMTCELFDQNGGKVKNLYDTQNGLLDMKYVPKGIYTVVFEVPELAAQGLYDVNFVAYPVNDKSVEISTANVKIQVVKDIKTE